MASIGIGIGFGALFKPAEPTWVTKSIATLFISLGILLVIAAERRARGVHERLTALHVTRASTIIFMPMTIAISTGAVTLILAIGLLT